MLRTVLIMSIVSGFAGIAILVIVNRAAVTQAVDTPPADGSDRMFLLFVLAIAIRLLVKQQGILRATSTVERVLTEFQIRVCNKLQHAEFEVAEQFDWSQTRATITNIGRISDSVFFLANGSQQAFELLFGLVYLASLSPVGAGLFVVGLGIASYYVSREMKKVGEANQKKRQRESGFSSLLDEVRSGFKELKLSDAKGRELHEDLRNIADERRQATLYANDVFIKGASIFEGGLFLVLGTIVFVMPQLIPVDSTTLAQTTMGVLFVFAPFFTLINALPQISASDGIIKGLNELEEKLDRPLPEPTGLPGVPAEISRDFHCLELRGIQFSYPGRAFSVGAKRPIDLQVRRGDVVFIVGGNGSGKSTLLKLFLGLYRPQHGAVMFDGRPITADNRQAYRELFAGVFADFCLFERLYGVEQIDQKADRIKELLRLLQIEAKVSVSNGRFSTRDLSTGQRKRLALLASLLEDRSVYVFDEWTADQDPEFRETFYFTILPKLKAEGKTVVTITHDDRYWKAADWRIHLDFGQVDETVEILPQRNGEVIEIVRTVEGTIDRVVHTRSDGIHFETIQPEKGETLDVIRAAKEVERIVCWKDGRIAREIRCGDSAQGSGGEN